MIPDPTVQKSFCPCAGSFNETGLEVLHRLSCIARNNSIYIAANMADKQPCLKDKDIGCPIRGHFQYNTEVVFNKSGCLVAKYHKEHLFLSEKIWFNQPRQVEHSYFDTEFGRFGLMICFDAVFKRPAIELVTDYNVTDIIFSTAWMNVYPHFVSVGYHSGWARTLKVNFLSSNLHHVRGRFVGSGVYSPNGVIDYTYNLTSPDGQLVVAKVPINNRSNTPVSPKPKVNNYTSPDGFQHTVFGDKYNFVPLIGLEETASVCYGTVCCHLFFSRSIAPEFFVLGAFNDMHHKEGEYHLEVCLLVQCVSKHDCGNTKVAKTDTKFYSYNLTAVMNTVYAFPEVITPNFDFSASLWNFTDKGHVKSISGNNTKVSSVVLMGRNFDKDPKKLGTNSGQTHQIHRAMTLFLWLIIAGHTIFGN